MISQYGSSRTADRDSNNRNRPDHFADAIPQFFLALSPKVAYLDSDDNPMARAGETSTGLGVTLNSLVANAVNRL